MVGLGQWHLSKIKFALNNERANLGGTQYRHLRTNASRIFIVTLNSCCHRATILENAKGLIIKIQYIS
jgi:hypothetical protein